MKTKKSSFAIVVGICLLLSISMTSCAQPEKKEDCTLINSRGGIIPLGKQTKDQCTNLLILYNLVNR